MSVLITADLRSNRLEIDLKRFRENIMIKSSLFMRLAKIFGGVGLIFIMILLFPIYDMPYEGCAKYGFLGFVPGCSLWPEFFLGMGLIAIVSIIFRGRILAHYLVFALIAAVGLVGGPRSIKAIKAGLQPDTSSFVSYIQSIWGSGGIAIILGAVLAMVCVYFIVKNKGPASR